MTPALDKHEDLLANLTAILFGLCSLVAGGLVFASTL
jgi:hypothetical protein